MLSFEERRRQILIWTAVSMIIIVIGWLVFLKWELSVEKKDETWKEILAPFKDNDLKQDLEKIKNNFDQSKVIENLSSTLENISSTTSTITTTTATTTK